jgi:hypothetical protein
MYIIKHLGRVNTGCWSYSPENSTIEGTGFLPIRITTIPESLANEDPTSCQQK